MLGITHGMGGFPKYTGWHPVEVVWLGRRHQRWATQCCGTRTRPKHKNRSNDPCACSSAMSPRIALFHSKGLCLVTPVCRPCLQAFSTPSWL